MVINLDMAEPIDLFLDTNVLLAESKYLVDQRRRPEFERKTGMVRSEIVDELTIIAEKYLDPEHKRKYEVLTVSDQPQIMAKLLVVEKYINPKQRWNFDLEATLTLETCIEKLSNLALIFSSHARQQVKLEWNDLRRRVQSSRRRFEIISYRNSWDVQNSLWWMLEQGDEEDLDLVRQIKRDPRYSAPEIVELLDRIEQRISERVEDPDYVVQQGESAYLKNKEVWDRDYAGQYIAIHRGKVIDSDQDKAKLLQRNIQAQKERGPFRSYIIHIGDAIVQARGPIVRRRAQPKRERNVGQE